MGIIMMTPSCKHHDEEPVVTGGGLGQKVYTDSEGLELTVNGTNMYGKTITFTPDAEGKAEIRLEGEPLVLSDMAGIITKAGNLQLDSDIPTAGVLPGSPIVKITVELMGESNECSFEGRGETEYCTYSYSGNVTKERLKLDLTDVKLKNVALVGTWTLPNLYELNPDWGTMEPNIFNVARVVWESEKGIELIPGWQIPMETIIGMALALPIINTPEKPVSLVEMLTIVLKSITFTEDGNIIAEYIDMSDTQSGTIKSPIGLAQYVILSDGQLRVFINPKAIIALTLEKSKNGRIKRGEDLTLISQQFLQYLLPMLSEGIPLRYGKAIKNADGDYNNENGIISFYLDSETLLPILNMLSPLFSNDDFTGLIIEGVKNNPNMGSMTDMLPAILQSLPDVINSTTKMELGINLKK